MFGGDEEDSSAAAMLSSTCRGHHGLQLQQPPVTTERITERTLGRPVSAAPAQPRPKQGGFQMPPLEPSRGWHGSLGNGPQWVMRLHLPHHLPKTGVPLASLGFESPWLKQTHCKANRAIRFPVTSQTRKIFRELCLVGLFFAFASHWQNLSPGFFYRCWKDMSYSIATRKLPRVIFISHYLFMSSLYTMLHSFKEPTWTSNVKANVSRSVNTTRLTGEPRV